MTGARDAASPIRPTDRLAYVLRRDERLIDVFVQLSSAFERLRSPAMRKTMARLVTVGQAAKMAGIEADELVERLNVALADPMEMSPAETEGAPGRADAPRTRPSVTGEDAGMPAELATIAEERLVEVDVRDALRRGEEPFSRIMAARREVASGGVLRLRAIFEPVPLYAVMAKQGFAHFTEKIAEDDWRVWFYQADADETAGRTPAGESLPGAAAPAAADADHGGDEADGGEGVVVLDVRGMEPPEPMVLTLEALERLPEGATLLQINVRVPRFLLPQLEERGFTYEIREQSADLVRVFIRRRAAH